MILAGDFNINVLDFEQNKKVQNFVNLISQFGLVLTINRHTRVTNKIISPIDHIITNSVYNDDFKNAIIRYLYKRIINESLKATLKRRLRETS